MKEEISEVSRVSLRKKYRITPDEEDAIAKEIELIFRNLIDIKVKNHSENLTTTFLDALSSSVDIFSIEYQQTVSVGFIEGLIGKLRARKIKKKRSLKWKK